MSSKEWAAQHEDVEILMSTDRLAMKLNIKMADKENPKYISDRSMDFRSLPLEQDELVLDDYLCSIYEMMYRNIKLQRGEATT